MSGIAISSVNPFVTTNQTSTVVKKETAVELKNTSLQTTDAANIKKISDDKVPQVNVLEEKKSSTKTGAKVGAIVGAIGGAGFTAPIALFATAFGGSHTVGGLLLKVAAITAVGGAVGAGAGVGLGAGIGAIYGAVKGK